MARFDTEADKLAMIDATLDYVEGAVDELVNRTGLLGAMVSMTLLELGTMQKATPATEELRDDDL